MTVEVPVCDNGVALVTGLAVMSPLLPEARTYYYCRTTASCVGPFSVSITGRLGFRMTVRI